MPEHRLCARHPVNEGLVDVYRITPLGNRLRLGSCLLIDISKSGFGANIDLAVERGEVLYFQNRTFQKHAIVCYCRAAARGYRIGMRFCAPPARDKEAMRGGSSPRPSRMAY